MSENNLKIRQKFVNKLLTKLADVQEHVDLLVKVDKKILRNNLKQSGGTTTVSVKGAQTTLASKLLLLAKKQEEVNELARTASAVQINLDNIQQAINDLNAEIKKINFTIPTVAPGITQDAKLEKFDNLDLIMDQIRSADNYEALSEEIKRNITEDDFNVIKPTVISAGPGL